MSDELPANLRPVADFFGLPGTAPVVKDFHIVRAIRAFESDSPNVAEGLRYLREAQRFIAAELAKATPAYETAIANTSGDDHWGDG